MLSASPVDLHTQFIFLVCCSLCPSTSPLSSPSSSSSLVDASSVSSAALLTLSPVIVIAHPPFRFFFFFCCTAVLFFFSSSPAVQAAENIGLMFFKFLWPRGPMDKASAYGAGDCRLESCRGHVSCSEIALCSHASSFFVGCFINLSNSLLFYFLNSFYLIIRYNIIKNMLKRDKY